VLTGATLGNSTDPGAKCLYKKQRGNMFPLMSNLPPQKRPFYGRTILRLRLCGKIIPVNTRGTMQVLSEL
jgi:hypothetical protein